MVSPSGAVYSCGSGNDGGSDGGSSDSSDGGSGDG